MTDQYKAWSNLQSEFPTVFGETACKGWLKFLKFEEDIGSKVILSVPSRFIRDWINARYLPKILELWRQVNPNLYAIDIVATREDGAPSSIETSPTDTSSISGFVTTQYTTQENLVAKLDPRLTFDNFVVGKSNELAYAAARRVAEGREIYFNPLFIYGGVGLGKTHLMHAVAWYLHHNYPQRKVVYMSAEKFMYQFVRALRQKDIISFREQFRSVDVLMIDDVQFISGKESTQEEFFHTFNALIDQKRQIILSADKAPAELRGIEERMRSRLGWGLVTDIHPSTYELRLGILQSRAEHLPVKVSQEVLELLAKKITSNIRELEGALNSIVAHATLIGGDITLETTQYVLKDLLRANEKHLTVDDIQRIVAQHFNIKISEMHSEKRLRSLVRPRQIAMYFAKDLTSKSLPEIGKKFGGRDHTTVIHAVKTIQDLLKKDPCLREDMSIICKICGATPDF